MTRSSFVINRAPWVLGTGGVSIQKKSTHIKRILFDGILLVFDSFVTSEVILTLQPVPRKASMNPSILGHKHLKLLTCELILEFALTYFERSPNSEHAKPSMY